MRALDEPYIRSVFLSLTDLTELWGGKKHMQGAGRTIQASLEKCNTKYAYSTNLHWCCEGK